MTLADFGYPKFRPFSFIASKTFNYLAFQSFDFERTWWRLLQKCVVHTKFDIYFFIQRILVKLHKFLSWRFFCNEIVFLFQDKKISMIEIYVKFERMQLNLSLSLKNGGTKFQVHHRCVACYDLLTSEPFCNFPVYRISIFFLN